jgi:DNA-binding LacI/PurR family transcriptional regulator
MPTNPTLAAIAREAGVSVPTVSMVHNQRADVAEATRRRVSEVLERRGYVRRGRPEERARRARPPLDVVLIGLGST